jgi:hypothetical protein
MLFHQDLRLLFDIGAGLVLLRPCFNRILIVPVYTVSIAVKQICTIDPASNVQRTPQV